MFKELTMELDENTFLTTVYTTVDTVYLRDFAALKPIRPGKKPDLSDSEVLTLMILAQWYPQNSERSFGAYAAKHWRGYFPRLLSQSQFNRRARDLCGVLAALGPAIARDLTQVLGLPAYEVIDGVPVPLMRRCRGQQHRCFADEAQVGRGGSDRDWYYGVQVLTAVNAHGLITGFVVGPANTEGRWLAETLFRWRHDPTLPEPTAEELEPVLGKRQGHGGKRRGPTGPLGLASGVGAATAEVYVGDLGFAGETWTAHWQADYDATVLTTAPYAEIEERDARRQVTRWLHSLRQVVENGNEVLTALLHLPLLRARTYWGVLTRLAAKVAAYNLVLVLNHEYDRPTFGFVTPFA
jgi:hypothetical protein